MGEGGKRERDGGNEGDSRWQREKADRAAGESRCMKLLITIGCLPLPLLAACLRESQAAIRLSPASAPSNFDGQPLRVPHRSAWRPCKFGICGGLYDDSCHDTVERSVPHFGEEVAHRSLKKIEAEIMAQASGPLFVVVRVQGP